ncbi:MAG: Bax inhibitor-1/YccA family protein, partial [Planctomycetia bacterium]
SILTIPYGSLMLMGGFIAVSWIAESMARSSVSQPAQYAGLALYVVAESIIFTPLLFIANQFGDGTVIPTAAIGTLALFATLTAAVFVTRKNFSFLGPFLSVMSVAALVLVVCSAVFGFSLGIVFTVCMIAMAAGYILYDTSNVLHNYRIGQHVAASLALFASVALLFWYIIRLVMALQSRD